MEKKISSLDLIPTAPNAWIWRDTDGGREFLPSATIPAKDEPLWHECTDADKAAYERSVTETNVEPNGDMPAEALRDTDSEEGSV